MAQIRLDLDQETLSALMDRALRERRTPVWQAEVMLRQALGLPFPYPPVPDAPSPTTASAAITEAKT